VPAGAGAGGDAAAVGGEREAGEGGEREAGEGGERERERAPPPWAASGEREGRGAPAVGRGSWGKKRSGVLRGLV